MGKIKFYVHLENYLFFITFFNDIYVVFIFLKVLIQDTQIAFHNNIFL